MSTDPIGAEWQRHADARQAAELRYTHGELSVQELLEAFAEIDEEHLQRRRTLTIEPPHAQGHEPTNADAWIRLRERFKAIRAGKLDPEPTEDLSAIAALNPEIYGDWLRDGSHPVGDGRRIHGVRL